MPISTYSSTFDVQYCVSSTSGSCEVDSCTLAVHDVFFYICSLKCRSAHWVLFFIMVQGVGEAESSSVLCSYKCRVFLGQPPSDSWIIIDIVLQKQHVLGPGTLQLEYDEFGHSCIVRDTYDRTTSFGCDDIFGSCLSRTAAWVTLS